MNTLYFLQINTSTIGARMRPAVTQEMASYLLKLIVVSHFISLPNVLGCFLAKIYALS